VTAAYGIEQMRGSYVIISASANALREINRNPDAIPLQRLYPDLDRLRMLANEYARVGAIPPLEDQPPAASAPSR
jgi:hypothetical protein